ncbi:GIY-YIG nuclease family protein [Dyadobacter psychrotolerans]|uniref:GIY-YIG nuclease family protein n=1 Tax=Dyadobacter psychrotolerans TaxID=2541721 RepID=A0A4R5DD40_9BACT|nr:GIY-YIG nuclease family protein [Dyadobacter psychrotolerans]TDE08183.1 GIY-YIG nuclease family protein [Dyadobacter psychrotolerans]
MKYVVYILFSESLGKFYAGQTQDIDKRLLQHNSGKGDFTSRGTPWQLIWSSCCDTRSEAVNLESRIKKRGIKRHLQDCKLL